MVTEAGYLHRCLFRLFFSGRWWLFFRVLNADYFSSLELRCIFLSSPAGLLITLLTGEESSNCPERCAQSAHKSTAGIFLLTFMRIRRFDFAVALLNTSRNPINSCGCHGPTLVY